MITIQGYGFTVNVTESLPDGLALDDLATARGRLDPILWSAHLAETLYSITGVWYEVYDDMRLWERAKDSEGDPSGRPIVANTATITLNGTHRPPMQPV
jgi:hypothetical protein